MMILWPHEYESFQIKPSSARNGSEVNAKGYWIFFPKVTNIVTNIV